MSTKDKSPTIATLDINLIPNVREQFLEDQNYCPLCGSELIITHVTNFVRQDVVEEAHCELCKIQTRKQSHGLQ